MALNFANPFGFFQSQPQPNLPTGVIPTTPQEKLNPMAGAKNEKLALMLYALGGALKGDKNFVQNTMQLQRVQEGKRKEEQQQKFWEDWKKNNPNVDPSIKSFGDMLSFEQRANLIARTLQPKEKQSLERFTVYDKNTGKPVRTILKSEAENIDRAKFIIGPLADPFADGKVDDDLETWAVTDRDGNRRPDLINPTEEEIRSVVEAGFFINKTPQLTSAGKAKDIGEIKGWNDQNGLEKRAISYNTLVNTGQRIINNLYENPESVLATGDIAQVFDQIGQEFKAAGVLINQEEKTKFVNNTDPKIKNAITELAAQTAITESQLLDFAYQIAKVRGQEGRGLSDQDFRNFQKIISAGRTAEQKASALYEFITGVGSEIKSELEYTRDLKNLAIGRNPQDREANAIITGINDLYTVGFGQINNPFIQQPIPTTQTTDGIQRVRIKL